MTPRELIASEWSYLQPVGVIRDPPGIPRLLVKGVNGGSDYTVGMVINGNIVMRLPLESVDDMTARVRRDMTLRGNADNEAITLYNPAITPKPIRNIQPRFAERMWG